MTKHPSIIIRHRNPAVGHPTLAYTGRIHRDFYRRFGVSAELVLDEIFAHGHATTDRYIFTLAK